MAAVARLADSGGRSAERSRRATGSTRVPGGSRRRCRRRFRSNVPPPRESNHSATRRRRSSSATSSSTELECVFFSCTPKIRQHFDDHAGFNFKLPRQLVDSDFLHRRDCSILLKCSQFWPIIRFFPWYQIHGSSPFSGDAAASVEGAPERPFNPAPDLGLRLLRFPPASRLVSCQIVFEHSCFDVLKRGASPA